MVEQEAVPRRSTIGVFALCGVTLCAMVAALSTIWKINELGGVGVLGMCALCKVPHSAFFAGGCTPYSSRAFSHARSISVSIQGGAEADAEAASAISCDDE